MGTKTDLAKKALLTGAVVMVAEATDVEIVFLHDRLFKSGCQPSMPPLPKYFQRASRDYMV